MDLEKTLKRNWRQRNRTWCHQKQWTLRWLLPPFAIALFLTRATKIITLTSHSFHFVCQHKKNRQTHRYTFFSHFSSIHHYKEKQSKRIYIFFIKQKKKSWWRAKKNVMGKVSGEQSGGRWAKQFRTCRSYLRRLRRAPCKQRRRRRCQNHPRSHCNNDQPYPFYKKIHFSFTLFVFNSGFGIKFSPWLWYLAV